MGAFELSAAMNANKVFLVNRSGLIGRLDASYNYALINSSLNTNYPTTTIGANFKSYSGGTPSKANVSFWLGDIPWASPKDFKSFVLDKTEDFISKEAVDSSATTIAPKGALLMVVRSGVLLHTIPVAITKKSMAFNQDVKAFIPSGSISAQFLGIYFRIYNDQILPLIVKHSTTVQSVNTAELNAFRIPALPNQIQQKIVDLYTEATLKKQQKEQQAQALLDSIDDYLLNALGITLPEQDNRLEKRMFTVPFSEVAGGRLDSQFYKIEFQQLVDNISSKKYFKLKDIADFSAETWNQFDYFDGTFPYIEISEIELITGEIANVKQVAIDEAPSRAKMIVRQGDIIISTTRPTRGAIAHNQLEGINIASTGFAVIRRLKNDVVSKEFLFYLLKMSSTLRQMEQRATGGNYPAITQEELGNIIIPYVEKLQQTEIAAHISQIRAQAKQLQHEAAEVLATAKTEIERMILGESA